jgi:hypothetical protein
MNIAVVPVLCFCLYSRNTTICQKRSIRTGDPGDVPWRPYSARGKGRKRPTKPIYVPGSFTGSDAIMMQCCNLYVGNLTTLFQLHNLYIVER